MNTTRRPLTNVEQVYKAVYLELCSLYTKRDCDEAEKLAWQYYQDPYIPLILRIMCCNVLGEAEGGEYLQFAREAVEHATAGLALEPENGVAQLMLRESKQILKSAEADAKDQLLALSDLQKERDKAEAEANELSANPTARNPSPASAHESQSQPSIMSPSASSMSTPQVQVNSMFSPVSYPQGLSSKEGADCSEDIHDKGF
ncbi:hypothetical protein C7974DRAFT_447371 [Boeremia exigua]|uniref:uncharacterized protein n=1 Tax=Boeremia exigua TaxID=749465 RepID=UPI001E8E3B4C|nr:uncharacterized protein C7974DRAFT_447371 [Boeremia exigua]KAH6642685.1 hypothetical protein C7974DRAFT_447371 [Boeremia exigua]